MISIKHLLFGCLIGLIICAPFAWFWYELGEAEARYLKHLKESQSKR
jgi:hypothetical protein